MQAATYSHTSSWSDMQVHLYTCLPQVGDNLAEWMLDAVTQADRSKDGKVGHLAEVYSSSFQAKVCFARIFVSKVEMNSMFLCVCVCVCVCVRVCVCVCVGEMSISARAQLPLVLTEAAAAAACIAAASDVM
jgi:hypothetical protein